MQSVFQESNISKAVITVSIPAMLAQLASLVYNLVDTYFVSITNSSAQISAVSLCAPVMLIIMSVASVFGMGGSSVIARLLGAKEDKKAATCFNFCLYATAAAGVIILAACLLFIRPVAAVIGATEDNMGYTIDYLTWISIGAPFIMLSSTCAGLTRSMGLIKESTTGSVLGNVVNIILDYVLIVRLQMGTAGAAMATSAGFFVATAYYIIVLIIHEKRGNSIIALSVRAFAPTWQMTRDVVQIGIPGSLMTILMSVANIVLFNNLALYGTDAVAAYGIAYKIDLFPVMLSVGMSQGIAPLIGYQYGQRNGDRLASTMRIGTLYSTILGSVFFAILLLCRVPLASIFMHQEPLIQLTAHTLLLLCLHNPIMGFINMISAYFQALGKAMSSLVLTLLRNAVLFIPGVIVLNWLLGLDGIILTQFIVEVILFFISLVMYLFAHPQKAVSSQS